MYRFSPVQGIVGERGKCPESQDDVLAMLFHLIIPQ
jgi:hypothetical protein